MANTLTQIECIIVEVDGELFDTISFFDGEAAAAYKRGIRRWARKAGVDVKLTSRTVQVYDRAHAKLAARLGLGLAS
jgi:hypothetical protein